MVSSRYNRGGESISCSFPSFLCTEGCLFVVRVAVDMGDCRGFFLLDLEPRDDCRLLLDSICVVVSWNSRKTSSIEFVR